MNFGKLFYLWNYKMLIWKKKHIEFFNFFLCFLRHITFPGCCIIHACLVLRSKLECFIFSFSIKSMRYEGILKSHCIKTEQILFKKYWTKCCPKIIFLKVWGSSRENTGVFIKFYFLLCLRNYTQWQTQKKIFVSF